MGDRFHPVAVLPTGNKRSRLAGNKDGIPKIVMVVMPDPHTLRISEAGLAESRYDLADVNGLFRLGERASIFFHLPKYSNAFLGMSHKRPFLRGT